MIDLVPSSPLDGLLPRTVGGCSLSAMTPAFITAITARRGAQAALAAALASAHDLRLPPVGRSSGRGGMRLVWAGQGRYFLWADCPASPTLAKGAALSDHSDAWVVMSLTGALAPEVLSRLCPLDLRASVFRRGHSAAAEIARMPGILRRGAKGFEIAVMRSFAQTAVQRIVDAMTSVAAQSELPDG